MNNKDIYFQTYLNLEKELLALSKYIHITDVDLSKEGEEIDKPSKQLQTYSPYIADLIIRCGVEIEALSKSIYIENGGEIPEVESRLYFDSTCLDFLNNKWNFDNKEVSVVAPNFNLRDEKNYILTPLHKSHIRKKPRWKKSYQALKHNRYKSLTQASVEILIHSLAALYLLNVYNKDIKIVSNYQDIINMDYSFGSDIFSVKPPKINQNWDYNEPIHSESPFVVTLLDSAYNSIEQMRNVEYENMKEFIESQPEARDAEFINLIKEKLKISDVEMSMNTIFIEFGKYKLKKNIDNYISFSDKKQALMDSDEWNGWVNQHNDHLKPEEISEDNIDCEIERVGTRWGIQLLKELINYEWINKIYKDKIYELKVPK